MIALLPVALSGPAPATAAPPTAGGIGIRLVDIPRDAAGDPRARAYIVDHLTPGTTIHRRIEVNNSTSVAQHVTLYAGGAAIVGDAFVPGGPDELSSWIRVAPPGLTLAPGAKQLATVTVSVPRTASAGERYATVWAQVKVPPSADNPITQIDRVGIRTYLDVGPGGDPRSDFSIGTVTAAPGAGGVTVVHAQVSNTGERAVDVSGELALTSADGSIHAGPYRSAQALTLLPGASGTAAVTTSGALPGGRWTATLTLTSGTITHTASGTITIGVASSLVANRPPHHDRVLGVALLIGEILIGLAVLGTGGFFLRRRLRRTATS